MKSAEKAASPANPEALAVLNHTSDRDLLDSAYWQKRLGYIASRENGSENLVLTQAVMSADQY